MIAPAPLTPSPEDLVAEAQALCAARDLAKSRGMDAAAALLDEGRCARLGLLLRAHPDRASLVGERVEVDGEGAVGTLSPSQAAALELNRRTI